MRLMYAPRALLALALLLGQLAAVMHLAHDLGTDGHDTVSCEQCIQAATTLGGALAASDGSAPLFAAWFLAPVHCIGSPLTAQQAGCLIRGPPNGFA